MVTIEPFRVTMKGGDIFHSAADAIVVPCSTAGNVSPEVADGLLLLGVSDPAPILDLGAVELRPIEGRGEPPTALIFAVTVQSPAGDGRRRATPAPVIDRIARRLGEVIASDDLVVAAPLLGTGAGGLAPEHSLDAMCNGFLASASAGARLEIYVRDEAIYQQLVPRVAELIRPAERAGTERVGPDDPSIEASTESFSRLSPSSKDALEYADGLRLALGQQSVHMEHLLLGLYQKPGGPMRTLLGRAHIDEKDLIAAVANTVEHDTLPTVVAPTTLEAMPALSEHVAKALQIAFSHASEVGSAAVRSRHLLHGALSVEKCSVVDALRNLGVSAHDVVVDDSDSPNSSPTTPDVRRAHGQERGETGSAVALSEGARRLLHWAAAIAASRSAPALDAIDPIDVVLGAMVGARSTPEHNSAKALYECLPDTPPRDQRLDAALHANGIAVAPATPSAEPDDLLDERAGALLVAASVVAAATTGASEVRTRHLVAAAVAGDPISRPVADALGVTSSALRGAMRSYIARRWSNEPSLEWQRVLAEPYVDLVHRFDGDQVVTWARRHASGSGSEGSLQQTDQLNVRLYATMLATLIARRSTADSLSIGLFGEWGSGKSTFMELIQQEIEQLTARARRAEDEGKGAYLTEIVPIWFNAWHYADANLWASLASELFDQLLGPRPDLDDERRNQLRTDLEQGQRRAEELRIATGVAQERAGRLRTELADAERRLQNSRGRLDAKVLRSLAQDESVKADLVDAARIAGLDDKHLDSVALLAREVAGTVDEFDAIRAVLRLRKWTPVFVVGFMSLLLLAAAVAFKTQVRSLLGGLSIAAIAVAFGQVGLAVRGARSALGALRTAAEKADAVEQRIVDQTMLEDEQLAHELIAAEGQTVVLAAQLTETLASVAVIEGQLQELTPGSRLYSFIAARAASSDYRAQLGVVSTIRRDFDQLAALMGEWRKARDAGTQPNAARRPIDRIVLYIDDLDRCEPDQVVAVLQAVNLLVAMDLFVVVVGVDPRWLLRSLRSRYASLLGARNTDDDDLSFRDSTPQDYLEKIFQVPFVLPGLGPGGLGQLLTSLVSGATVPPPSADTSSTALIENGSEVASVQPSMPPGDAVVPSESVALTVEGKSEVAAVFHRVDSRATVTQDVTAEELALLSRLHQLVRTPRSAKRLFNIYRLLRSTRDLGPADRFLGSDGQPGEHQAVAILLGVLTAYPEMLGAMLWGRREDGSDAAGALCRGGGANGWRSFVHGLRPRTAQVGYENDVTDAIDDATFAAWTDLVDALESLLGPAERPLVSLDDIAPFRLWGPRVARFSFVLSAFAADEAQPVLTDAAVRP